MNEKAIMDHAVKVAEDSLKSSLSAGAHGCPWCGGEVGQIGYCTSSNPCVFCSDRCRIAFCLDKKNEEFEEVAARIGARTRTDAAPPWCVKCGKEIGVVSFARSADDGPFCSLVCADLPPGNPDDVNALVDVIFSPGEMVGVTSSGEPVYGNPPLRGLMSPNDPRAVPPPPSLDALARALWETDPDVILFVERVGEADYSHTCDRCDGIMQCEEVDERQARARDIAWERDELGARTKWIQRAQYAIEVWPVR